MKNHCNDQDHIKKILGIGIGPANLSLAALLSKVQLVNYAFFDTKKYFSWHPGMLFPDAKLQVSYLEDLVTLVDPTNPHSFISFLKEKKRLYRFIYANFDRVLRIEFNEYFSWVSQNLQDLYFNEKVEDINFANNHFTLQTSKRKIKGQHLVLGNGILPFIPPCAVKHLNARAFHSSDFLQNYKGFAGKRIAVIGGGQSSAEIIDAIISDRDQLPAQLYWITRRHQFQQLDESAFVYELFSPLYNAYFYTLNDAQRKNELKNHTLANNGISSATIKNIYQKLYAIELIGNNNKLLHLMPNYSLEGMHPISLNSWSISCMNEKQQQYFNLDVDIIIFCTGYQRPFPMYLKSLRNRIDWQHEQFDVNADFSIKWDGPSQNRIYVQNAAQHRHGLADTSLCLIAWRSAKIINSIIGREYYPLDEESVTIDWNLTQIKKDIYGYTSISARAC